MNTNNSNTQTLSQLNTSGYIYQPQDSTGYWPQPTNYWRPYPYWHTMTIEKEVEPKRCMGKAHVFECDHVKTCQCGKIARVMPKEKK